MLVFIKLKLIFLKFQAVLRYKRPTLGLFVILNASIAYGQSMPDGEDLAALEAPSVGSVTMVIGRANLIRSYTERYESVEARHYERAIRLGQNLVVMSMLGLKTTRF